MKPYPKFQPKDKALHISTKEKGYIEKCINLDDGWDIREQGFRYYVIIGHVRWSIPEKYLIKI